MASRLYLNRCEFIGDILGELKPHFTKDDKKLCRFVICTEKSNKRADGTYGPAFKTYISCVAWGMMADKVLTYYKRFDHVRIVTSATTDMWIDKDTGKKRYSTSFYVQTIGHFQNPPRVKGSTMPEPVVIDCGEVDYDMIDDQPVFSVDPEDYK